MATPAIFVSIVTPTYNRREQVRRSIDSALAWMAGRSDCEIVVVDDGSTDGTLAELQTALAGEIAAGRLRLTATPRNLGATGAKNHGGALARGRWLMFLDSDDELLAESAPAVIAGLEAGDDRIVHFLRCVTNGGGALIGDPETRPVTVDAATYLNGWRWAECLPVVRRDAFERFPYPAELRGHEGIAYARMMQAMGPAVVQPIVARTYDDSGADRLSTRKALRARAHLLARGYLAMIREFPRELGPAGLARMAARVAYYGLTGLSNRLARS